MRLFGLIGFPLTHSFSKKFFTEKFEREGLSDCRYENFPIPAIEDVHRILAMPGLEGLNVTIPYKELIIPYLNQSSVLVKKINACNCIKIKNGKLLGFNTDIAGFENSLLTKLNSPKYRQALILGTGGSSKAVKYVLHKLGIEFKMVSRKPAAGILSYEQLTREMIQQHLLIINTTPLGMYPNVVEAPPLPYQYITPDHFLFDLIYNPEKTLFLKKGEDQGARIQNGYEMLVLQAEENWKIWNADDAALSSKF